MKKVFDEIYKVKDYFGKKPDIRMTKILDLKDYGSVLDLGVGHGKNSLFLAKKGFELTGVDFSKSGIESFLDSAKNEGLEVKGILMDITKFVFSKKYDIIISTATLNFLKKEEIYDLIKKIKDNTEEDGLNVIMAFTDAVPSKVLTYSFKKNELRDAYKDWKILYYDEYLTSVEEHKNQGPHRHSCAFLIAQNKSI